MVYLLISGLFELSDSIGHDLAFQFRALQNAGIKARVFAGQFQANLYPDIPIEPAASLRGIIEKCPAPIIYHWVVGWDEIDDWLMNVASPVIIRWHNNTPPWFFAPYSPERIVQTLRGFSSIVRMAQHPKVLFWAGSDFTLSQLEVLGIYRERARVVYPASFYIENSLRSRPDTEQEHSKNVLKILFVGRVTPNKGHKHILLSAHCVKQMVKQRVEVYFAGRSDPAMQNYVQELKDLAKRLDLSAHILGEVTQSKLTELYQTCDVFACLSEHEGFGLPVLEAMCNGLPVVGYRTAAVAETLAGHPLCVDRIDYNDIARRICVAAEYGELRDALYQFQIDHILPRFSKQVIEGQIFQSLKAVCPGITNVKSRPESPLTTQSYPTSSALLESVDTQLAKLPRAHTYEPKDELSLAHDYPNHYVTLHDIYAYESLLKYQQMSTSETDLWSEIMSIKFSSTKAVVGKLISFVKWLVLAFNEGVVRAIIKAQGRVDKRLDKLENKLDNIRRDFVGR